MCELTNVSTKTPSCATLISFSNRFTISYLGNKVISFVRKKIEGQSVTFTMDEEQRAGDENTLTI